MRLPDFLQLPAKAWYKEFNRHFAQEDFKHMKDFRLREVFLAQRRKGAKKTP